MKKKIIKKKILHHILYIISVYIYYNSNMALLKVAIIICSHTYHLYVKLESFNGQRESCRHREVLQTEQRADYKRGAAQDKQDHLHPHIVLFSFVCCHGNGC